MHGYSKKLRSAHAYHSAVNAVFEHLSDKVIQSMLKKKLRSAHAHHSAADDVFEHPSNKVILSMHGYSKQLRPAYPIV